MAILLGSYDPEEVIAIVGPVTLNGFSDGTAITVRRDEDVYFKRVGLKGHVARARNANKSGSFEFRLLQTSSDNDLLSALFATDDLLGDGRIVIPASIIDLSGRTLCAAGSCWIRTLPEVTLGKEVEERIWILDCADLAIFAGGNPT